MKNKFRAFSFVSLKSSDYASSFTITASFEPDNFAYFLTSTIDSTQKYENGSSNERIFFAELLTRCDLRTRPIFSQAISQLLDVYTIFRRLKKKKTRAESRQSSAPAPSSHKREVRAGSASWEGGRSQETRNSKRS